MQFFNFDCFAVLSIDTYDNDPEGEPYSPELRGFWLTASDAQSGIEAMKADRAAASERQKEAWLLRGWGCPADWSTFFYAIVPLSQLSGKYFCDVEDELKAAAALQFKGIGKYDGGGL